MQKSKALLFWSSGKDSAWSLQVLRQQNEIDVVGLVTTVNEDDRVSVHALRQNLLEEQAVSIGLPLWKVPIPKPCSNKQYEETMQTVIEKANREGIAIVAFGDLFLEDIRQYREKFLEASGLTPLFPIWGQNTSLLAREMIQAGLRAKIICVDQKQLSGSFAGREFDYSFLKELPESVDPCGERGEFHTFAYGGPMFSYEIPILNNGTYEEESFLFVDLDLKP